MSEKQRILLTGDVEGRFTTLFSKVEQINKKSGPFDFLLCVGNFFGVNNTQLEPYKNGSKNIPIPTLIIGPNRGDDVDNYPDLDGGEICQNLTYLGKRGLYSAGSGLKIAYISGLEKDENSMNESTNFGESDVVSVRNSCLKGQPSFRGIDILLTSQWPQEVTKLDPKEPKFDYKGSKLIAWLAAQVKPRYHVCGFEGIHYERPPYRNVSKDGDSIEIASRFIALARVGNPQKLKWLYALNLTPVDRTRLTDLAARTTDETPSPYPPSSMNSDPGTTSTKSSVNQFFYDMQPASEGKRRSNQSDKHQKKPRKQDFDQAKCWFCLSSPSVEKNLVISVGTEVYVALAKGGLVDDHLLILPISHHQSFSIVPESVEKEMELYKKAIARYYSGTGRLPVFFERNFKSSHCQLQAVPVPEEIASELYGVFQDVADDSGVELNQIPDHSQLRQIAPPGATYFYAQLPNKVMLYTRIAKDFPLQFGREVLASEKILNLPHKVDWKDCQISKEDETDLAKMIRKKFEPYEIDT